MTEQQAYKYINWITGYLTGFVVGVCTCAIAFWLVR